MDTSLQKNILDVHFLIYLLPGVDLIDVESDQEMAAVLAAVLKKPGSKTH